MSQYSVMFLGKDLYDVDGKGLNLVSKMPNISERVGFKRDMLFQSNFTLECQNIDNYFSVDNSRSLLNGIVWLFKSLQITNPDGELIWDGIVNDIRRNHRTQMAYLESQSVLAKWKKVYIEYQSNDWETGAEAAKNIMDNYSFSNYDTVTIQTSHNQLDSESCYLKCNFNLSDNVSLYEAIEKLGIYSGCDVYGSLNQIYFKLWRPFVGGISKRLQEEDLRTFPLVSNLEVELINDYSISYNGDGGTPATDSNSNNIGAASRVRYGTQALEDMRSDNSASSQIVFKDKTSATYVGEVYINRSHYNLSTQPRALQKIQFDVDLSIKELLIMGNYFTLDLSAESWTDKIFQIYEIRRNEDQQKLNIVAYEVWSD